MKSKKWVILLIVAFPSFFWLILETSTINSRKLPYYGPKKVLKEKDTLFYKVPDEFFGVDNDSTSHPEKIKLSKKEYPLYAIIFIHDKYRNDAYRLTGLWEYLNYKKDKVEHIPFILVTPSENGKSREYLELKTLSQSKNVHFFQWEKSQFDSIVKIYFQEKPYYIDYSFFMLIDDNRNVRGYYDARYVSEIKRLIEEYKHLRLKEEKQLLIQENEIKQDN